MQQTISTSFVGQRFVIVNHELVTAFVIIVSTLFLYRRGGDLHG